MGRLIGTVLSGWIYQAFGQGVFMDIQHICYFRGIDLRGITEACRSVLNALRAAVSLALLKL